MLNISIPGYDNLCLKYLVLDYNGTIAKDGVLIDIVSEKLHKLVEIGLEIYVITADTHNTVAKQCGNLPVKIHVTDPIYAAQDKLELIEKLGKEHCIAIGNGRNDWFMLKESRIGVCVLGEEGIFSQNTQVADILVPSIASALDLFLHPQRLTATLRG